MKSAIAEIFIRRFTFTEEEKGILTSNMMTPEFFATLERARHIQKECKSLLLSASEEHKSGYVAE
jgi:hypothetical protein